MSSVLYAVLAILLLSVLIVLHELGHYLVGKWLGFGIEEFSIGMGPVLFRKKGEKTDFTLRAFLIGGSCRFIGEDEDGASADSFNAQKAWKRFLVVLAGPMMNFFTALVLAFILLLTFGTTSIVPGTEYVEISTVAEDSAAAAAELKPGDVLLAVNGSRFTGYDTFKAAFDAVSENEVDVLINRGGTLTEENLTDGDTVRHLQKLTGGEEVIVHVTDIRDKRTGNNLLGVNLLIHYGEVAERHYNVLTAAGASFPFCGNLIAQVYGALFDLFTGKACVTEMSGVVGTVSVMTEAMETASAYGVRDVIYVILMLGALISVNFAVVNLLPIPALDGGRLVFIVLEMLRGKPIPPEKEGMVHFAGMVLLLGLVAVLMVSDILKFF